MKATRIHMLRITLDGIDPPIWRELAAPSDFTFGDLHMLIQAAMGWDNEHMHQFDNRKYGKKRRLICIPSGLSAWISRLVEEDEDTVTLSDVWRRAGGKLYYEYDCWMHTIEVLKVGKPERGQAYPRCLGGERACPPEGCGSVWDYTELAEVVVDPSHELYEDFIDWVEAGFDPEAFDLEAVNARLAKWGAWGKEAANEQYDSEA